MKTPKLLWQYLLAVIIVLTACGESRVGDASQNVRPDFDRVQVIHLSEVFQVSTFDDENFFGSVTAVIPAAGETILVSDIRSKKIYKFDESGSYRGYLGGDGAGPGEFRQPGFTGLLGQDTLMVMDWQLARITLFGYDQEKNNWNASRFLDRPGSRGDLGDPLFFTFNGLFPYNNGYLGRFNTSFTPADTVTYSRGFFTHYDYDLNPLSDLEYLTHIIQRPLLMRDGGRISIGGVPENHRLVFHITGDGRFVSSWNGGRDISIRSITGADSTGFSFPSARLAISSSDKREMAIEHLPNPDQALFTREQLIERIPDYRGYSRHILMDDEERIWILAQPFEEGDPEWLVFDASGNLLFAVHHPGGTFYQIRNNRIYVSMTADLGEPAFAVYSFSTD